MCVKLTAMLTLRTAVNAVHTRHRITTTLLDALVILEAPFSHAFASTVTAVNAVLFFVLTVDLIWGADQNSFETK